MKEICLIKKISQRSWWVKKVKTEAWWENFSNSKVPESDSRDNFRVSMKSFYELLMHKIAPIFAEETESFEKPNVSGEGATGKL